MRAFVSHSDSMLRVTTDGGRSETEWVIVTRAQRYAGGFLLSCAKPVSPKQSFMWCDLAVRVHLSDCASSQRLCSLSFSAMIPVSPSRRRSGIGVESDVPVPVQVDGEILGALPAEITLHPKRLQLIFP